MKKKIIHIIKKFRLCKFNILRHCLKGSITEIPEFSLSSNQRVIIIAPHADDELIGCYGILSKYKKQVKVFYCSLLGENVTAHNKNIRERELMSYLNSMQIEYFISNNEIIEDLSMILDSYEPAIIALPSYVDWHSEHRKVNEILHDLLAKRRTCYTILWYHVSLPIPYMYVNCVTRFNKQDHRAKWYSLISYYKSQLHMDIDRFRAVEQLWCDKDEFSETYLALDTKTWIACFKILSNYNSELNCLKKSLGNLYYMVKNTEKFYKNILK